MYTVPAARAWWHAVGSQVDRVVSLRRGAEQGVHGGGAAVALSLRGRMYLPLLTRMMARLFGPAMKRREAARRTLCAAQHAGAKREQPTGQTTALQAQTRPKAKPGNGPCCGFEARAER